MRPRFNLEDLGAVVPAILIESTVTAAMKFLNRRRGRGSLSRQLELPVSHPHRSAGIDERSAFGLLPKKPFPRKRDGPDGVSESE